MIIPKRAEVWRDNPGDDLILVIPPRPPKKLESHLRARLRAQMKSQFRWFPHVMETEPVGSQLFPVSEGGAAAHVSSVPYCILSQKPANTGSEPSQKAHEQETGGIVELFYSHVLRT